MDLQLFNAVSHVSLRGLIILNPNDTKDFFLAFTLKNCIFLMFFKFQINPFEIFGFVKMEDTLDEMTHFWTWKRPLGNQSRTFFFAPSVTKEKP